MADAGALAPVVPFHDPSRKRRLVKVAAWIAGICVVVVVLDLAGVDVTGWLSDLWKQIKAVPPGYIVAALAFQTGQTVFCGLSYYGILGAAYPGEVTLAPIVTAYAVGVAMNNFLPANIGTFVTLLMFVALIPSCTVGGAIAAYLVQKIFFTIAGHVRLPLPLPLGARARSTSNLGNISAHPVFTVGIVVGGDLPDRGRRPDLLAAGEEALGPGEEGRRDPVPAEALPDAGVPARRFSPTSASTR